MEAGQPRLPLSYFTATLPVPDGWAVAPSATWRSGTRTPTRWPSPGPWLAGDACWTAGTCTSCTTRRRGRPCWPWSTPWLTLAVALPLLARRLLDAVPDGPGRWLTVSGNTGRCRSRSGSGLRNLSAPERADPLVELAAVVAADRTSTTSMPPLGLASACSSSASDPTFQCGVRVAAHRLAEVDAVRRAEQPVVAVGVRRRALLEHREDRAAVVVDDHDRQVGPGLVGARAPARSRRAGTSRRPSARSPGCVRGRPSAAPIAVETVPSMPDRPRLAITLRRPPTSYGATIRSRSRIGLEAPTTSSPSRGRARLTAPATSYGVSRPRRRAARRAARRPRRRRPATPRASAGSSAPRPSAGRPMKRSATANGRSGQTPPAPGVEHLDVVAARAAG